MTKKSKNCFKMKITKLRSFMSKKMRKKKTRKKNTFKFSPQNLKNKSTDQKMNSWMKNLRKNRKKRN